MISLQAFDKAIASVGRSPNKGQAQVDGLFVVAAADKLWFLLDNNGKIS